MKTKLIILGLIVLVLAGGWYYKTQVAGWKTYTNETCGFVIKYPPSSKVDISSDGIDIYDGTNKYSAVIGLSASCVDYKSLDSIKESFELPGGAGGVVNETTFADKNGYEFVSSDDNFADPYRIIRVPGYQIHVFNRSDEYKKILSTFKFTK